MRCSVCADGHSPIGFRRDCCPVGVDKGVGQERVRRQLRESADNATSLWLELTAHIFYSLLAHSGTVLAADKLTILTRDMAGRDTRSRSLPSRRFPPGLLQ